MADTPLSALDATTTLASGDLLYVVDGGNSRKIDYANVVIQLAAATKTLTNTTFDANGTGNSVSNIETADLASGSKSGADATVVTGTAGTDGNLVAWNVDGDAVDSGSAPSAFATAAQGALADSAQQPPLEGPFVNGDKTKLDGIEAGADVTDTANVTAAGALMDSEVTNLAAVKAFDPTDYATAAQGALADTATQPADIALMVESDVTGVTGADAITNIMSLTQAEYDAITPDAATLYVITG
jgi:hypothetical protein